MATCECGLPARHRDRWCHTCYERLRRTGGLELLPKLTAAERFFAKIRTDPDGCWIWTGAKGQLGYGKFNPGGRGPGVGAHRWSYEHAKGRIPDWLSIDHLCRVPSCVNPDHLEAVPLGENVRRAYVANGLDVACRKGHPKSESWISAAGHAQCRACKREQWREHSRDPDFLARHAARQREYMRRRRNAVHDLPQRTDEQREHEARRVADK